MARRFKQLTKADRLKIEALDKAGHTPPEIAKQIGVHRSTIYRELARGRYTALNSDLTTEERYSPDIAHEKYRANLKEKGAGLKIGNDIELANYIEKKIAEEDYSPAAVLGEMKATGKDKEFSVTICTTTLYSYIDKGIFLRLTNKELPVKGERRRKNRKVRKVQKRAAAGDSIEKRPEEIETRQEFGNWEMDTVMGQQGKSKDSLLVLSERKTRNELIFMMHEHTAAAVVSVLDGLEEKYGEYFRAIFKTITVDNGTEFSDCAGMEQSSTGDGSRTKLYYCHPYSSWERGTNENINKMVRRKIPKGANFDGMTDEEVQAVEDWINGYPRGILGYLNAGDLFKEELAKIGL